jgi:hypothetical protein
VALLILAQELTEMSRQYINCWSRFAKLDKWEWQTRPRESDHWAALRVCSSQQPGDISIGCSLYYSIRNKFQSFFENVVLGRLKTFFQLDHWVDVSLYFTEATALCHSREFNQFDSIIIYIELHKFFGFPYFRINFISFHVNKGIILYVSSQLMNWNWF